GFLNWLGSIIVLFLDVSRRFFRRALRRILRQGASGCKACYPCTQKADHDSQHERFHPVIRHTLLLFRAIFCRAFRDAPDLVYCSNDVTTLTIVKTWQSQRKLSLLRQDWTILRPYASTIPEERKWAVSQS